MITIKITDGDRNVLAAVYRTNMTTALNAAFAEARRLVTEGNDLYLRDVLGGLRAEVRMRDGKISTVKT